MKLTRLAFIGGLAVLAAGFTSVHDEPLNTFPHRRHAKLFPTGCAGCHAGIPKDSPTDRFPTSEQCAQCHNGRDQKTVSWSAYTQPRTNLEFSHAEHACESGRDSTTVECQSCHRDKSGDDNRMAVTRASPGNCITCHAHKATAHLADEAKCATCHVPLTRAVSLTDSDVARFPKPASHRTADFVATHGARVAAGANCVTCHSRESCARCHPNSGRIATVAGLEADARIARLVKLVAPVYPTPASHRVANWWEAHGAPAKSNPQNCANCHVQSTCRSCHAGSKAPASIAVLAVAETGGPTGATVAKGSIHPANFANTHGTSARSGRLNCAGCHEQKFCARCHDGSSPMRGSIHPANFATTHGASAGSGRLNCAGCHEQKFCSDCHDGNSRRRFHASNYMSRHAADAYAAEKNCTSCHSTESFCRTCHLGNGVATQGAGKVAAHTGQPLWLLQHSQAARQGLEGCTTCHQQRDCLKCHSTLGWSVNPHGRDFDASRYSARNRQMCLTCHVGDPLKQP